MAGMDAKRQFPRHVGANPGRKDVLVRQEKEKLIRSPSRGPKRKKSKAKGKS